RTGALPLLPCAADAAQGGAHPRALAGGDARAPPPRVRRARAPVARPREFLSTALEVLRSLLRPRSGGPASGAAGVRGGVPGRRERLRDRGLTPPRKGATNGEDRRTTRYNPRLVSRFRPSRLSGDPLCSRASAPSASPRPRSRPSP